MIRRYVSLAVLLVLVGGIAVYLSFQPDLLAAFANISPAAAAFLIGVRLLFVVTNGLFLRTLAARFGVHLSLLEWVGIPVVTTMGNYLTPFSGGMVARAAYLKHRHDFPYAQFATLLVANYLITFWVVGLVGFITLLFFIETARFYSQIALFFLAVTVGISGLTLIPPLSLSGQHRLIRAFNTALHGWASIKNDWLLIARLMGYTLLNIFLNGLSFWIAYRALGFSVSFAAALLIGLLTVFSLLLNFTPGNLGLQEAVISLSSVLLGSGAGAGLLVALVIRATTVIVAFTLGPLFSYLLTRPSGGDDGLQA